MICPKCRTELPDNILKCSNCGIRVNIICPDCKTYNKLGTINCVNCKKELVKICPQCKSNNLPNAQECRKCHYVFKSPSELTEVENLIQNNETNTEEKNDISESNIQQEIEIVKPFSSFDYNQNTQMSAAATGVFNDVAHEKFTNFYEDISEIENIFNLNYLDENTIQETSYIEEVNIFPDAKEPMNIEQDIQVENKPENLKIDSVEDIVVDVNTSIETENDISKNNSEPVEEKGDEQHLHIEIQKDSVIKAINLIKNSINKHIIAINGSEGTGKSAVLKQIKNNIQQDGFLCLYGSCTPLLQITSFGFFQDAFLRLLGFPPFIKSTESFIRDFKKSNLSKIFKCLNNNELNLFLNIFYPNKSDAFENIVENKKKVFSILEKVITSLLLNNNIVISIDNFELLDGASYDFIVHLMQKGYFNNRLKLVVAYQTNKAIENYFDIVDIDESVFETIIIEKLNKEELIMAVERTTGVNIEQILTDEQVFELVEKSDGNAIRLEQETALLFDSNYIAIKNNKIVIQEENKPTGMILSFEELVKLRLNTLVPITKNVLFIAATMGFRFSISVLDIAIESEKLDVKNIINYLVKELYIDVIDNYTCEFKSLTLWKIIYQEAKVDSLYKDNAQRLYSTLKPLILSSNIQKLISCKAALTEKEEFDIWKNTAKLSAKLGDTNLYVISQKQRLKLLETLDIEEPDEIRAIIYEEIGKLLSEKSPKEAMTYIANVLEAQIKSGNICKIIDLSAYFIKSCYINGSYFGVTEAVDSIISAVNSKESSISYLDLALIKTRKLSALYNIGNCEQIINLVNEEIIPEIDNALNYKQEDSQFLLLLIHAWLLSKITLAKAYAMQGNKLVFNEIENIRVFLDKYNYNKEYYTTQIDIIEAFGNSVTGYINNSNVILNNLASEYKEKQMATELLAEWNLIHVINRILSGEKEDLKSDLFEFAAFTNNINEHSVKNIVKLLLGYILQEEGNKIKAIEIFNEEITYFAKEKIAIGAMLSWALIVNAAIDNEDFDKALNTATKSLEIAQSAKINNYLFIIYFQKQIAKIYLHKQDLIATKMYLEKSIMLAKQYKLKYLLIDLCICYGKYMEEYMSSQKKYSQDNIKMTLEMYNKAITYSKELQLKHLAEKSVKARASFKVFCQLNSISI